MNRDERINIPVTAEEKRRFLAAAEALKGFDGGVVPITVFMRTAAHRLADQVLKGREVQE